MKRAWSVASIATLLAVVAFTGNSAYSEALQKHPRVAELEDGLRESASLYLKARFPDRPFLVSVSVDPLRRLTGKSQNLNQETLPYFDPTVEEIQDEWDDPQVSSHHLLNRTNKISVNISLSKTLSDNESAEVKEALMKSLHLIPARDEILFTFRSWGSSGEKWFYPVFAVTICILFLVGFFLIQRSGVAKIAHALATQKASSSAPASAPAMSTPMSAPTSPKGEMNTNVRGGVQISDPIRAKEMMTKFVDQLTKKRLFPTLSSMIMLEKYGSENYPGLGALIGELPEAVQNKLYAFGSSEHWFKALNSPGMFTMQEIEIMQKLVREPTTERTPAVEEMMITVWRLDEEISEFIRTYPRDIALTILHAMPKGVGISSARKAFPGAWADLLDPNFGATTISDAQAKEISARAHQIRPLGNIEDFRRQKSETELREYLLVASPEEEREIYLASKADAAIHRMRDPFYVIFEAEDAVLKGFVQRLTPEQWALALFNVNRANRKKIQAQLPEKQSFLLMEYMKQLDASNPDATHVGQTREKIGTLFKQHAAARVKEADLSNQIDTLMKEVKIDGASGEDDDDSMAA